MTAIVRADGSAVPGCARGAFAAGFEDEAVVGILEYPLSSADEIVTAAWGAMSRQENDEALRLWQRLRQQFPERPEGYVREVQMLWQAGRLDEAEAMAADAGARFPEDPDMLVQHAWIAMLRERWDEALKWWGAVRERAPDRSDAYIWAARALWRSGRIDEAKEAADRAVERFPGNPDAQAEGAWVAVARRDWEDSLRRWLALVERAPGRPDAHIGAMQGLRMLGRFGEAETMGRTAIDRFPDNTDVMTEHVWIAVGREDWPAARARLDAVRSKLQDASRFEASLGWIEYRVRSQLAEIAAPPAPSFGGGVTAPETADATAAAELMLAFESLGERCDFGAVQRKFGVEPLGLLRFAYTRYDPLLAALEDRFAAVGTEADTSFELFGEENIIYMKKYGVIFHTFVYQMSCRPRKSAAPFTSSSAAA
jgi:tetratricopeptide (TPR) repeat protein